MRGRPTLADGHERRRTFPPVQDSEERNQLVSKNHSQRKRGGWSASVANKKSVALIVKTEMIKEDAEVL